MTEDNRDYKQRIADLLDKYEDGRDVFIKNHWDDPLKLKPGTYGEGLTDNWMGLMEQVTGIIGKYKYGLDTYENEIQVMDSEQMLDVYVNHGMPDNFTHWSNGKKREELARALDYGQMQLAYEMVINSDPSISYCMTHNTNVLQALVIAHAAQGHNALFKNNVMFKEFTNAQEIRGDLKRFAYFVDECEKKYGIDRVERILDACNALEYQAIDYAPRPIKKTKKQIEAHKEAIEQARINSYDAVLDTTSIKVADAFKSVSNDNRNIPINEQNLLRYIADAAPHLETWERQIIHMFCDRAQYFYPQMRTKLINEGFASFWHHKIMHDLYDEQLLNDGMMLEFMNLHNLVLYQQDFAQFNPYILGFHILTDLERMCKEPTEEDRKWFPEIAGNPDWLSVIKDASYNYHDETFVYQFLSPKVIRDFHMFAIKDDDQEKEVVVTAIHDEDGYKRVRSTLSENYDLAGMIPNIRPDDYNDKTDRALTLKHVMFNRKPLDEKAAAEVLKHVHALWGHPIVLNSINEHDVVAKTISCPTSYSKPKAHLSVLPKHP